MSPQKAATLQIVIALIFAAAMIFSKQFFGEESDTVRNLLVAIWWIPFSWLCFKGSRGRCSSCNKGDSC